MDFKGCVEKSELLERAERLWHDNQQLTKGKAIFNRLKSKLIIIIRTKKLKFAFDLFSDYRNARKCARFM